MAINIQEILHPSDSDSIKFEKINYNFDQILANGGGPSGPKGQRGDQGQVGSTGAKGQKGDIGTTGLKGNSGASDSPWYKVQIDSNSNGINEVTILKPKVGTDLNSPIIWLGDSDFKEDVTDGDITTNARLTIEKDDVFENYIKLWHSSSKGLVMTSTSPGSGYTKFNWQNAFQSTNIEYGISTDKITLTAATSIFDISGQIVQLKSLNNTNIKLTTLGTGILDVDINAEFKGYLRLPAGSTGSRPTTPQVGMIRYNTSLDIVEAYYENNGTPEWRELCTDCGAGVGDTITIIGGDINANIDGSPVTDTITIIGGDINANLDGSPVGSSPTPTPVPPTATPVSPTPTPGTYTHFYLLGAPGNSTITGAGDGSVDSTQTTTQVAGSMYSFDVTITANSGYEFNQTIVNNLAFAIGVPARMAISNQVLVNSTTITATLTDLNFPSIPGGTTTISWTTGSAAVALTPLTFTVFSSVEGNLSTGRSYTWNLSGYPQNGHKIHMGIYGKDQVYTITGTSGYDLSYDVVGAAYAAFLNGLTSANWIGGTAYTYTQGNPVGFEPTASYDSVNNRLTFNMNWQNSIGVPYTTTS